MRGKWLLMAGVVVLAAIAGGALMWQRRAAAPPRTAAPRVVTAPVPGEVTLSGKIRARNVVSVGAAVAGNIEVFFADVGQEVADGQLLARVNNQGLETGREVATIAADNAQARLTKVEAQLVGARLEASRAQADASRARSDFDRLEKVYERQKLLNSEGATPRLAFEKASREYEAARGDLDTLDRGARQADARVQGLLEEAQNARKILDDKHRQLEDATSALATAEIRSPADGTVVGRKGEVGKSGQDQGDDLFQIATDMLELEVDVEPEPPVLERLKAGQAALVLISDFQSEGIPGKVREIKGTIVSVEFTSPDPAIKPGLNAEVRIRVGE